MDVSYSDNIPFLYVPVYLGSDKHTDQRSLISAFIVLFTKITITLDSVDIIPIL